MAGNDADRVFLCYKRSYKGNPITDLKFCSANIGMAPEHSEGYSLLKKSPLNYEIQMKDKDGTSIRFCYKQKLATLQPLLFDFLSLLGRHTEVIRL